MEEQAEEISSEEELSEEEEPHTQRFSVVIVWPPGSVERLGPGDLQAVIEEAISELDETAAVGVTEIAEPTY